MKRLPVQRRTLALVAVTRRSSIRCSMSGIAASSILSLAALMRQSFLGAACARPWALPQRRL